MARQPPVRVRRTLSRQPATLRLAFRLGHGRAEAALQAPDGRRSGRARAAGRHRARRDRPRPAPSSPARSGRSTGQAENVGQALHRPVGGDHAAIDAQDRAAAPRRPGQSARIASIRSQRLVADAFQRRAGEFAPGRCCASGRTSRRAPRRPNTARRARRRPAPDRHPALGSAAAASAPGLAGRARSGRARRAATARRAGDEDRAFERVGRPAVEPVGDRASAGGSSTRRARAPVLSSAKQPVP